MFSSFVTFEACIAMQVENWSKLPKCHWMEIDTKITEYNKILKTNYRVFEAVLEHRLLWLKPYILVNLNIVAQWCRIQAFFKSEAQPLRQPAQWAYYAQVLQITVQFSLSTFLYEKRLGHCSCLQNASVDINGRYWYNMYVEVWSKVQNWSSSL